VPGVIGYFFAVVERLNFTFAGHAVNRFQVILIVHAEIGTSVDGGDMEGKPHVVIFQQHARTLPVAIRGNNAAVSLFGLLKLSDDHVVLGT
jgi:hypothetical protein